MFCEEFFKFGFGPLRIEFGIHKPFKIDYFRKTNSHCLRIKFLKPIKKEDIKVRFSKEGVLEIEWPSLEEWEEISVE